MSERRMRMNVMIPNTKEALLAPGVIESAIRDHEKQKETSKIRLQKKLMKRHEESYQRKRILANVQSIDIDYIASVNNRMRNIISGNAHDAMTSWKNVDEMGDVDKRRKEFESSEKCEVISVKAWAQNRGGIVPSLSSADRLSLPKHPSSPFTARPMQQHHNTGSSTHHASGSRTPRGMGGSMTSLPAIARSLVISHSLGGRSNNTNNHISGGGPGGGAAGPGLGNSNFLAGLTQRMILQAEADFMLLSCGRTHVSRLEMDEYGPDFSIEADRKVFMFEFMSHLDQRQEEETATRTASALQHEKRKRRGLPNSSSTMGSSGSGGPLLQLGVGSLVKKRSSAGRSSTSSGGSGGHALSIAGLEDSGGGGGAGGGAHTTAGRSTAGGGGVEVVGGQSHEVDTDLCFTDFVQVVHTVPREAAVVALQKYSPRLGWAVGLRMKDCDMLSRTYATATMNGTAPLDLTGFVSLYPCEECGIHEEDLELIFNSADEDGDGVLSKAEFASIYSPKFKVSSSRRRTHHQRGMFIESGGGGSIGGGGGGQAHHQHRVPSLRSSFSVVMQPPHPPGGNRAGDDGSSSAMRRSSGDGGGGANTMATDYSPGSHSFSVHFSGGF